MPHRQSDLSNTSNEDTHHLRVMRYLRVIGSFVPNPFTRRQAADE